MTSRRLLILAALAVMVIAGALLLARHEPAGPASADRQLLYPELKSKLDGVDTVRVFKAGDMPIVEAKRTGTDWTIADRAGYPADVAKVRKFLIAAADAKLVEEKTSNPANYGAIGVEDVKEPSATGHRVEIGGGTGPVNLIVGKQAAGARSQFVRRVGDKQSWQISDSLDLPTTTDAWLRKDILDVAGDRVQSATITIAGGRPYSAAKAAHSDGDFRVEGLPKGKELSSPAAANSFSSALTALTLSDVRKSQEISPKPVAHTTIRTFDGLVTELDGWTQDSKHYLTVATSYDESLARRFKAAPEPAAAEPVAAGKEKSPAKSAEAPAHEPDVAAESKALNAKLAGWTYEIPEYKYDAIFKPLDELLKK